MLTVHLPSDNNVQLKHTSVTHGQYEREKKKKKKETKQGRYY